MDQEAPHCLPTDMEKKEESKVSDIEENSDFGDSEVIHTHIHTNTNTHTHTHPLLARIQFILTFIHSHTYNH